MDLWTNPAFPSAVPEESPAVCHCAKCKYSNDSFPKKKKVEKRKQNGAVAEVCIAGSPRTKQMNKMVEISLPHLLWAAASLGHL